MHGLGNGKADRCQGQREQKNRGRSTQDRLGAVVLHVGIRLHRALRQLAVRVTGETLRDRALAAGGPATHPATAISVMVQELDQRPPRVINLGMSR